LPVFLPKLFTLLKIYNILILQVAEMCYLFKEKYRKGGIYVIITSTYILIESKKLRKKSLLSGNLIAISLP